MTQAVELRHADAEECRAGGLTPDEALEQSKSLSTHWWEIRAEDGTPICWWGYAAPSLMGLYCNGWMLSTPEADNHKFYIARQSRFVLANLLRAYPTVQAQVDVEHSRAVRWLKWLGFHEVSREGRFALMRITSRKGLH